MRIQQSHSSTAIELIRILTASWTSRAVYTAAKLGIADVIRSFGGGPVPVEQIARTVAVHPSALHRLLRALASIGVFRAGGEPHGSAYSLSPLAEHLLTGSHQSLKNAALMYGEEMALTWHELPSVISDEKPAWKRVLGREGVGIIGAWRPYRQFKTRGFSFVKVPHAGRAALLRVIWTAACGSGQAGPPCFSC
jgi:hypothetical protein